MSVEQELYIQDPLYQQAQTAFQSGAWQSGLENLEKLSEKFPVNSHLRGLNQEMRLRAAVDDEEKATNKIIRRRKIRDWVIRLILLIALGVSAVYGVTTYSAWLRLQVASAQERLEREVRTLELSVKFRDAQNLLQVGRLGDAQLVYQQIASVDPEFPGLQEAIGYTEKMVLVETAYDEAILAMDQGNLTQALEMLENLQAKEPYYKDVSIRIAEIKSRFFLGDVLAKANQAYQAEDWINAASGYETLRALDATYQADVVDERLFNSYMNAAIQSLARDDTLEALDVAEIYFRKALTLRPQDPVIQLEREQARQSFKDRLYSSYVDVALNAINENSDSLDALATAESYFRRALELRPDDLEVARQLGMVQLFIGGQADFTAMSWTDAIIKLEDLYRAEPTYAGGTALQLLYDSYTARGDDFTKGTNYESALSDHQRAAVLAGQMEGSKIRQFQVQVKIAEIQGILGDFEIATQIYATAFDLADFSVDALQARPELRTKIQQAEANAQSRYYRSAYRLYRDAARSLTLIFPTTEYVVQSGDYLAQIANRYNTTVQAILLANNLNFSTEISPGKSLVIPVQQP